MMTMKLLLLVVTLSGAAWASASSAFKDGELYRITSALDNNTLSIVGDQISAGSNLTAEPWLNLPKQKFLAVEAVVASDYYMLMPQSQHWNWERFIRQGSRGGKDRRDDLPDFTLVLSSSSSSSSQLVTKLRDGKKDEQWVSVASKVDGKVLIKNRESGKCIKNPGTEPKDTSILHSAKKGILSAFGGGSNKDKKRHSPAILEAVDCDGYEPKQQWILESTSSL